MGLFSSSLSVSGYLGIDIGYSSIKIVELKKEQGQPRLVNYGFSESQNNDFSSSKEKDIVAIARSIDRIFDKAGIASREAVGALPAFSVFSSIISLPNVSKKDMQSAIHWEAKKVIPLPLEEMILDWKEIEDEQVEKKKSQKILLTGAPKSLVKRHVGIFREAQVNLLSLETETFSLIRSLLGSDKSTVALVEIGSNTTDVSIVDKSIPMFSRSIDVGGNSITDSLSGHLNISREKAEQFKYDLGMSSMENQNNSVPKTIIDSINPIVNEIKYAINLFQSKNNKKIEKVVLSGGSALLPDLTTYLSNVLDVRVLVGDPWARISCPVDLKPLLNEIGPRLSVAIGLALRQIE